MTDGGTSPTTGGRRTRLALLAVAVVLAIIGTALITTAVRRHGAEPPETAGMPAAAPDAVVAPEPGATTGSLTSGPQMRTSPPTRIRIPALHVDVPVIGLGRQADGSMQVPDDAATVGWYTGAPTPGSLGPAVMAGHVDYRKRPGTFAHLADLIRGDTITVARRDDTVAVFTVAKTERYAKDRFPSAAVYGPIDHAGLRLITCGGDFDDAAGHYRDNIVVYATLTHAA